MKDVHGVFDRIKSSSTACGPDRLRVGFTAASDRDQCAGSGMDSHGDNDYNPVVTPP
jgi:hypothetical protein